MHKEQKCLRLRSRTLTNSTVDVYLTKYLVLENVNKCVVEKLPSRQGCDSATHSVISKHVFHN